MSKSMRFVKVLCSVFLCVLSIACWILFLLPFICALCPYRHLEEANQTLEAMLRPKVTTLPGHIQAVYVQNMVKLYASILQQKEQAGEKEAAQEITQLMIERLPQFVQSADLEVQERVREQNDFGIYHGESWSRSVVFCGHARFL